MPDRIHMTRNILSRYNIHHLRPMLLSNPRLTRYFPQLHPSRPPRLFRLPIPRDDRSQRFQHRPRRRRGRSDRAPPVPSSVRFVRHTPKRDSRPSLPAPPSILATFTSGPISRRLLDLTERLLLVRLGTGRVARVGRGRRRRPVVAGDDRSIFCLRDTPNGERYAERRAKFVLDGNALLGSNGPLPDENSGTDVSWMAHSIPWCAHPIPQRKDSGMSDPVVQAGLLCRSIISCVLGRIRAAHSCPTCIRCGLAGISGSHHSHSPQNALEERVAVHELAMSFIVPPRVRVRSPMCSTEPTKSGKPCALPSRVACTTSATLQTPLAGTANVPARTRTTRKHSLSARSDRGCRWDQGLGLDPSPCAEM